MHQVLSPGRDALVVILDQEDHRRLDVQGLRAAAVIMVVAFHAGLPMPGGFVGVDVFSSSSLVS